MNSRQYRDRRQLLARHMREAGGGLAIVPTAPEHPRNGGNDHPFRYDSHFHYLSGFVEPQSWLVLRSDGHSILFCRTHSPEHEIWNGHRLGPEAAPQQLGVDEAHAIERLDELMPELIRQHGAVWTLPGSTGATEQRLNSWLAVAQGGLRPGATQGPEQRNLAPLLDNMRLIKDAHELDTMRRAARISAGAHARAMRFCGERFRAAPQGSVREYEIEAELLHEFRRHGAQSPAYPSIVAAGANTCVLHYAAGNTELRPGELCLIDAGCELDGYASDITRTFPANGRFSGPQRELYGIVLAAQNAAVEHTRPGARQRDAHHAAVRVLTQGMLDTGLLQPHVHGNADDAMASMAYRQFYMHSTGHWLGLDVHDVGDYLSIDEAPFEQPDGQGNQVMRRPSRLLEPGMVLTLEPGLYVRPAAGVPEAFWHIGIRIEDDVVITRDGCELISREVPVDPVEIEALMRG